MTEGDLTELHEAGADGAGPAMLTDGVDLRGGKLRPWYERQS